MKIKPLYIYGAIILIIVAMLLFLDTGKTNDNAGIPSDAEATMPQDEIHQGLGNNGAGPSKSDVKPEFYQRLENLGKEVEANPQDTAKIMEYAQLLSLAHQSENALKQYEKILKVDPNRIDVLLSEGLLYYNLAKYDEAEKATKRVLKVDGNYLEAKFNLGIIAVAQGDKEKAKKIWTKLVKDNPGSEAAKYAKDALAKL
ncbi:MAG: tetratricopeptide repeat protein [Chlorobi bacterium]|nr:tetratricopeptide repeat protein [Chlorobiota bacterium]